MCAFVGNVPNGTSGTIATKEEKVSKGASGKTVSWADRVKNNIPTVAPTLDPMNLTHQIAKEGAQLILLK